MEYVYAALLLDAAGKEVTEKHLEEIIKAAGLTPDEARAKAMVASLKGVNIKEVIKNAQSMQMSAVPASAAPAAGAAAPKAEAKKDAEAEKKSEEEAASGLASLFG